MRIYPISYCIPEEMFVDPIKENDKTYSMAPLIPGRKETYIYDNENDYYSMYANSKYALTSKKGGWDCLRHYEILACGSIPIFNNLFQCPFQTMNGFPRKQIMEMTEEFNNTGNISNYDIRRDEIFNIAKEKLTCTANAKYFLNKIFPDMDSTGYGNLKILMLCGTTGFRNVNYSRETLAIGLRRVCGNNFVEYPKLKVLYKGCKNLDKYIGRGFTYGNKLDNIGEEFHNIQQLEDKIKNGYFDLIVYGKVGNKHLEPQSVDELEYWNIVKDKYDKNHIVFLYGGDITRTSQDQCLLNHAKYGICFVREYQEIRFSKLRMDRSGAKILSMLKCEAYFFKNNLAYGGAVDRPSKYYSIRTCHMNLPKYLEQCIPLCNLFGLPRPKLDYDIFINTNITINDVEYPFDKSYLNFLYERCKNNFKHLSTNSTNEYIVAIHIRRGDVTKNGKWMHKYIPNNYYVDLIERLKASANKNNKNIKIYIFSEKVTDDSFDVFEKLGCVLMIETDLVETWNYFIMADLLVTAPGAFSVVPALIRPKGNIIYTQNKYMVPQDGWIIAESDNEKKFVESIFD